jgi:hypothetical protein
MKIFQRVEDLEKFLGQKIRQGLENSVPAVQETINIDTQRAYSTIRVESDEDFQRHSLIVGGVIAPGIIKETGVHKPTDYVLQLEARYSILSRHVDTIRNNILNELS